MRNNGYFGLFWLSVVITTVVVFGCGQEPVWDASLSDAALEQGTAVLPADRAVVLYAAGDVTGGPGTPNAAWAPLGAGDLLASGTILKTGQQSECEVQFGAAAVAHIAENTEVAIDEMSLASAGTRLGYTLNNGTLLCKVEKLTGQDRFRVKTRTAVLGVRGTEFGVTVSGAAGTTLAVREGRVGLLPRSFDPDDLGLTEEEQTRVVSDALRDAEEVVGPGQEAGVSDKELAATREEAHAWRTDVRDLARKKRWDDADRDRIRARIRRSRDSLRRRLQKPEAMRPDRRERLKPLENLRQRLIAPRAQTRAAGDEAAAPATPRRKLVRIRVRVEPRRALISLNGRPAGRGRFQGLFAAGDSLKFEFSGEGLVPQSFTVTADPVEKKRIEVRLQPAGPERVTPPPDIPTDELEGVKRRLEREEEAMRAAEEKFRRTERRSAPEAVVASVNPSGQPIVGEMIGDRERVYAVDAVGTVLALDRAGKVLWRLGSSRGDNPFVGLFATNDKIYYAGHNEIIIIDSRTGRLASRYPAARLKGELFRQRFLQTDDLVVIPSDNRLQVSRRRRGRGDAKYFQVPDRLALLLGADSGDLFFCDDHGKIFTLSIESGAITPEAMDTGVTVPEDRAGFPPQNHLYVAGRNGTLACLDTRTRKMVWEAPLGTANTTIRLAVDEAGVFVYAARRIQARTHDGRVPFAPLTEVVVPPLVLPNRLVVARVGGGLDFVNAANGRRLRSMDLPGPATARPAALGNLIVVGTGDGTVLFIDPGKVPEARDR